MNNVINDPEYAVIARDLRNELHRLQSEVGDERYALDLPS
jgi:hypothetical protein